VSETTTSQLPDATKARLQQAFLRAPLIFEANQGQTDSQVKFLARGSGYSLFLTPTEAVLAHRRPDKSTEGGRPKALDKIERLKKSPVEASVQNSQLQSVVRMKLKGANSDPKMVGVEELPGKVNYFIGNDPEKWRTNVPTYAKVEYRDLYPGVDVVYYGNQRQLEYDFVVSPGTDPSVIQLAFEGTDKIDVDSQGDLILHTALHELKMHKPLVYQEVAGVRKKVAAAYVLNSGSEVSARKSQITKSNSTSVGFQVASYDLTKTLVIDPVLVYSTYLGGNGTDYGIGIAVDSSGNAYITGLTESTNFPTANAFQATLGGGFDAFVTTINSLAFLSFPLSVDCAGNPCNPYTAMISSVMDHSGTPLESANPGAWYSIDDKKVKAFNGELGEAVFGVNCEPGPGYKNQNGTDFLSSMNYVGARCSRKKQDQENEENKFPKHFLNYNGHSGYDYPYPAMTPIIAPFSGKLFKAVIDSVNHNSTCNFNGWNEWHTFYIDHENGFTTWYLHAEELAPEIETQIGKDFTKFVTVKKGQTVGFVGSYAKCSKVGAHLHFEARRGRNEVVDPYGEGLWEATP